jgi:hypothetical protein
VQCGLNQQQGCTAYTAEGERGPGDRVPQLEAGLEALEAAMANGFEQYGKIRSDPNLANLRKSKKFTELINKYDEPVINENAIKCVAPLPLPCSLPPNGSHPPANASKAPCLAGSFDDPLKEGFLDCGVGNELFDC